MRDLQYSGRGCGNLRPDGSPGANSGGNGKTLPVTGRFLLAGISGDSIPDRFPGLDFSEVECEGKSVCASKFLKRLKDERGQTLLIILGVASVVMILIMALMAFTSAEVKDARSNQTEQNLIWVGRSARTIVQERFTKFLYGPLATGVENKARIDDDKLELAVLTDDPLRILEHALCVARQEAGEIRFRVDLSDTENGMVYDVLGSGEVVTNNLDEDRQFDAMVTIKPGGPAHFSDDGTMYVFPIRFESTVHCLTRTKSTPTTSGFSRETMKGGGSFAMFIRRSSFCRYLLFMESASGVYLTTNDELDGPIHTNGNWNFMDNPGAKMHGRVTQTDEYAGYYANGSLKKVKGEHYPPNEKDPKKIKVKPTFDRGFYRGVPRIDLPQNLGAFKAGVLNGRTAPPSNGVSLPERANSDGSLRLDPGGIYVKGDAVVQLQQGANTQTYIIEQTYGNKKYVTIITCDYTTNSTSYVQTIQGVQTSSKTYQGVFCVNPDSAAAQNALYVDGRIDGLNGQLDENTRLSICASGEVVVNGDIKYERQDVNASNRLGILSENGNVVVDFGYATPQYDVYIDGSIMTPKGCFEVRNNLRNRTGLGKIYLFGGIISKQLGATESSGGRGYGTASHYDARLQFDPPPLFPEPGNFDMSLDAPTGQDTLQWLWSDPGHN